MCFNSLASITDSPSGLSAGAAAGVSIAVILIIIIVVIVVICIRKRERNDANTPDEVRIVHEETRSNPSFAFDVDDYEDINDKEYEYVKSSKWDVSWGDLNLSGQILGKGNFGEVQLGKVRIKGRWMKAAVKTLKDGTPDSEKALFKEEFATMTRIGHHPNVVNILGSCEYAGSLYVILEYVPHGNLRKFLRKSRLEMPAGGEKPGRVVSNLNPDQLLKFAVGVAEAMKHISATGIIHRDLAARNILVGKGLTSKVADFGMSREENIYVQASSQRVPTRWLSIESLTEKMYTTKSDVWSFGILLWEIATLGGTPYSDMETKYLAYHLTEGYRMPKPDNCEQEMYDLMLKCWQENPDDRPSFQQILDILLHMTSQEKIYMSTQCYENFKYAAISLDKDDR
ncbi:angiopoietin-1 receptor-like [Amphiura filiformis]|uniref:angiopoietin-1 receptor-like n=1 Tax=Amphiura filiformis TaxID=82378 RepID=UPI003B220477